MTTDDLTKTVARWTHALGITQWKLDIKIIPKAKLEAGECDLYGVTVFDDACRTARIWVADADASHPISFEFTLLHELVHVMLADVGKDSEELLINVVSRALFVVAGHADALITTISHDGTGNNSIDMLLSKVLGEIAANGVTDESLHPGFDGAM